MKTLPKTLKKNSFVYTQIERTESKAIYSQYCPDAERIVAYEVFIIRKHKGYEIAGKHIEPAETYPHNEAFGKTAWKVRDISKAMEKYRNLIAGKPK